MIIELLRKEAQERDINPVWARLKFEFNSEIEDKILLEIIYTEKDKTRHTIDVQDAYMNWENDDVRISEIEEVANDYPVKTEYKFA